MLDADGDRAGGRIDFDDFPDAPPEEVRGRWAKSWRCDDAECRRRREGPRCTPPAPPCADRRCGPLSQARPRRVRERPGSPAPRRLPRAADVRSRKAAPRQVDLACGNELLRFIVFVRVRLKWLRKPASRNGENLLSRRPGRLTRRDCRLAVAFHSGRNGRRTTAIGVGAWCRSNVIVSLLLLRTNWRANDALPPAMGEPESISVVLKDSNACQETQTSPRKDGLRRPPAGQTRRP